MGRFALGSRVSPFLAALRKGEGTARTGPDVVQDAALSAGGAGSTVAWAGDRLLYVGRWGSHVSVLAFSPASGEKVDLIPNAGTPATPADARTIVYTSLDDQMLMTLWKADADGRRAEHLATGTNFVAAGHTRRPAGALRVAFGRVPAVERTTRRRPAGEDRGHRRQGSRRVARREVCRLLSFVGVEKPTVGICDLPACSSQRRLPTPGLKAPAQSSGIRWTPDGRGIAYLNVEPQPNIWIQPLDGSPPQQLTHFTDGRQIPDFAWSHDGTRLAVVRAETSTDIVLYRGLRR